MENCYKRYLSNRLTNFGTAMHIGHPNLTGKFENPRWRTATICLVTPEIMELIIWRKSTYTSAFVMLTFRNAMEHWNADGRINSDNDHATPDINMAGL